MIEITFLKAIWELEEIIQDLNESSVVQIWVPLLKQEESLNASDDFLPKK